MKKTAFFIATILLLSIFVPSLSATVLISEQSEATAAPLTPALSIIADDAAMAKSGLVGNKLAFSHNDFCRALNLSDVGSITITSLPDAADGKLLLGTTAVSVGQKISRANLDALVFDPASSNRCSTSFDFNIDDRGYGLTCSVYMLSSVNASPVTATAASVSLDIDTHSNTAAFGKLSAYDPENDSLTYEIVSYPKNGLLFLTDPAEGKYVYLPLYHFTGKDSFKYVVQDKYGNYSAAANVSITVNTSSISTVYADMVGNPANNAAICVTEKGLMSGVTNDTATNFNPNGSVTRCDFLVMSMKAAGISELPASDSAGFYDDNDISSEAMSYVATAKQLGYIDGTKNSDGNLCFYPNENITRAEAALIVDRIIGGSSLLQNFSLKPNFKDANEVPVWAEASVNNLSLLGMLHDSNKEINAIDKLSRADAAIILSAIMKLK